ncbi:hypothetical protein A9Q83_10895 [Alphaproteobacteria bacterium 46_93_T64]|nr:hypothetical protein A9Q83_10895 [Alphaproteobacteria bacterium 46_93_T64]
MHGNNFNRESFRIRVSAILFAIIAVSVLMVGAGTIITFDRAVEPELSKRTRLIASIAREDIQRALDIGIKLDEIVGLERYLGEVLHKFDEVEHIAVSSVSGEILAMVVGSSPSTSEDKSYLGEVFAFSETLFKLPILDGNKTVGDITIKISPLFIQSRIRSVFLDVTVIALVAMLIALELVLAVAIASVDKPLTRIYALLEEQVSNRFLHTIDHGGGGTLSRLAERLNDRAFDLASRMRGLPANARSIVSDKLGTMIADHAPHKLRLSDVADIRLTLFLFSAATEISTSFLPIYARDAARPLWLSSEFAAAGPILMYLIALAALSPFGGRLSRRFGARNLFFASVPPTILALIMMGWSDSVLEITFWRGVMALFYATATIACQEFAVRASGTNGNNTGISAYITVIFAGVLCGSAMGGVISGRFGFEIAFFSGAFIASVAGLTSVFAMRGRAGDPERALPLPDSRIQATASYGLSYWALVIGVAAPMSATVAIFIWYMTPLMLSELGLSPADIARVVMLYYLCTVVLGPLFSHFAKTPKHMVILVVCGALISVVGLYSMNFWQGVWPIVFSVTVLGLGHAVMRIPLYVLALDAGGGQTSCLTPMRLVERCGAVVGLAISALLLNNLDVEFIVRALAAVVLVGIVLFIAGNGYEKVKRGET